MLYESVQQPPEIVTLTKRKTEKAEVLVSSHLWILKSRKIQKKTVTRFFWISNYWKKLTLNSAWTWRRFGDKWGRIRWFYLWLVNFVTSCLKRKKKEISEVSDHTKQNWKLKKEKNTIIQTRKKQYHTCESPTLTSVIWFAFKLFSVIWIHSLISFKKSIYFILIILRNEKWTKSPFGPFARMIYPGTMRFKFFRIFQLI